MRNCIFNDLGLIFGLVFFLILIQIKLNVKKLGYTGWYIDKTNSYKPDIVKIGFNHEKRDDKKVMLEEEIRKLETKKTLHLDKVNWFYELKN